MDVTELMELDEIGGLVSIWMGALVQAGLVYQQGNLHMMDFFEFLRFAVKTPVLKPLLAQTIWYFSIHLDKFVGRALNAGEVDNDYLKEAKWDNADGRDNLQGNSADSHCARHVEAACEEFHSKLEFSMPTDKASVCRLTLQNSVVGCGNFLAVCCPSVAVPWRAK